MALFSSSFLLLLNILIAYYFFIIFCFLGAFNSIFLNTGRPREIIYKQLLFNLLLRRRRLPLINIYYKEKEILIIFIF